MNILYLYLATLCSLLTLNSCLSFSTTQEKPIQVVEEAKQVIRLEPRAPQPMMPYLSRLCGLVVNQLMARHYSPQAFDDKLSEKIYNRYIELMDPYKLFFTQEDLAQFEKSKLKLEDEMKMGYVVFPYTVSELSSRRAEEFLIFAQQQLDNGIDCRTDSVFVYDSEKQTYPKNRFEQEQLWINFIRKELLRLRLQKRALKENINLPGIKKDIPYIAALPETERVMVRLRLIMQSFRNTSQQSDIESFINAITLSFDPHCTYNAPKSFERSMSNLNLTFHGIGIAYSMEDGVVVVGEVIKNGPTAQQKADLKPHDILLTATERDATPVKLKGLSANAISDLIRGPKGSIVSFDVQNGHFPDSPIRRVSVKRGEVVSTPTMVKSKRRQVKINGEKTAEIGIITVPLFYQMQATKDSPMRGCSADIEHTIHTLNEFGKVDGIILDLRSNPGGFLPEAVNTMGLFIDSGPVVQIRQRRSLDILNDLDSRVIYDGPLICMINRQSASASEIVSGALKDYERAIIVGDSQTYGKGTVQNVINLDMFAREVSLPMPVGGVNLTIAKFYRINGATTQIEGVESDIVIPSSTNAEEKLGERNTQNPLTFDTITPLKYKRSPNSVKPYLPQLRRLSSERIAQHPWYIYFAKQIEESKKKKDDSVGFVLHEDKRFEELKEIRDRNEKHHQQFIEIKKQIKSKAPQGVTPPTNDFTLEESLQIMTDYLNLLSKTQEEK